MKVAMGETVFGTWSRGARNRRDKVNSLGEVAIVGVRWEGIAIAWNRRGVNAVEKSRVAKKCEERTCLTLA